MDKVIGVLNDVPFTVGETILELSYLLAALLFVFGLKRLSHPETARKGNMYAGAGMLLAMITTILLHKNDQGNGIALANIWIILSAIGVGTTIGWIVARKIRMTAMPQLVSLYNGTGGGASMLVALLEYPHGDMTQWGTVLVTLLGLIVGSVTFSGSMIAYGKLDGKVGDIRSKNMKYVNMLLLAIIVVLGAYMMLSGKQPADLSWELYGLFVIALVYGVLFVRCSE